MTIQIDYGTELAAMERDCSCAGGYLPELAYPPSVAVTKCSYCNGKGKVPVFPGVRVPCECHLSPVNTWYSTLRHSYGCPGYTVSDRLEDYLGAIHVYWRYSHITFIGREVRFEPSTSGGGVMITTHGDYLPALLEAMWKAVKPLSSGGTLYLLRWLAEEKAKVKP